MRAPDGAARRPSQIKTSAARHPFTGHHYIFKEPEPSRSGSGTKLVSSGNFSYTSSAILSAVRRRSNGSR